uniref:Solute-binding protein family 3/N-terminal domain-containing protein n=1 Tax=Magnetococcus massalia (strain MO-1) TaxID=451514 RepID=A0A1S7LHK0_MAGMO|nr:Exported protein of unknown function [Candidatus Magnetococcus massalia]
MKHPATYLLIAFFCLATLLTPVTVSATEKKSITWLVWELSPEYIRSGPMAGQGFADHYLNYFIKHLPEYQHRIVWTSIRRFHREALRPGRCAPHIWGHFYPDRFVYSKPYLLTPPHMAIFHRRFEERFGPTDQLLSLVDLLEREKLTLMTPKQYKNQHRYPVLHPYMAPYLGTPQIKEMSHAANEVDLRLIERGRADFSLGYPTTIHAQKRDRGIKGDFIAYGLQEHQTYKEIHVGCFGDEQGQAVVAKINGLRDRQMLEQFLGLYEEWNDGHPLYRRAFHEKILSTVE